MGPSKFSFRSKASAEIVLPHHNSMLCLSPAQFILADVSELRVYFRSADHHVCVGTPNGGAFYFMMMIAERAMVHCAKQWWCVTNTVRKDLAFALIIRPMH